MSYDLIRMEGYLDERSLKSRAHIGAHINSTLIARVPR